MHLAGVVLRYRIIESAVILARLRRLGKGVQILNCGTTLVATFWPSPIFQDVGLAIT